MERISLDRNQQQQIRILTQLVEGRLTTAEAAASLGRSVRWVEGIRPAFRRDGVAALLHGNSGRTPANAIDPAIRKRVQELAGGKYAHFNFQQLQEKLAEKEDLELSPSSIRRICLAGGIGVQRPQQRRPRHRKRRQRRAREGEMLQADGSPHDWLEGRGPRLTLISFVDDATSRSWREFREGEDLEGYMRVMWRIVLQFGVPEALYTDRTVIVAGASQRYKALGGEPAGPSQFGRVLNELGVAIILANSAQAKGRVERSHGTDQDRLCSELRLARASTLAEANAVVRAYDRRQRFLLAAADPNPAWQPRPTSNLADIFCIKEGRVVSNDNVVRVYQQSIHIPPGPGGRSYAGARVTVHRRYDGTLGVVLDGKRIGGSPPGSQNPDRRNR